MLQIGPASLATIPLKSFYCCRYFSGRQRTKLRNFGQKSFSQTAASCVAVQPFLRAFCEKKYKLYTTVFCTWVYSKTFVHGCKIGTFAARYPRTEIRNLTDLYLSYYNLILFIFSGT